MAHRLNKGDRRGRQQGACEKYECLNYGKAMMFEQGEGAKIYGVGVSGEHWDERGWEEKL